MNGRANQVVAQLTLAQGKWVDSDTLARALGIGRPQVAAAVSEARKLLGYPIETHKIRAVGWRLPPDTMSPAPPALAPLSANGEKLLAALEAAGGQFVSGKALADPLGKFPSDLGPIIRHIMNKRPGLLIQGRHGLGYRLVIEGVEPVVPAAQDVPKLPRKPYPQHVSHRAAIELLGLLAPHSAERVRDIALETGQTPAQVIERLLEYGIEVHRDLIVHGEHPLQLGRAA